MQKFAIGIALTLAAVGAYNAVGYNRSWFDSHWEFQKAIIKLGDEFKTVNVKKWTDFEQSDMIQVETETQVYLTHSTNVVLIKNK